MIFHSINVWLGGIKTHQNFTQNSPPAVVSCNGGACPCGVGSQHLASCPNAGPDQCLSPRQIGTTYRAQVELQEDSSFIGLATPQRLSQSSDNSLGTFDCNNFQLNDKAGVPIDLKQRPVPARVITNLKTKSWCSDCARWAVKFLIVEGDKDFLGASKAYEFPTIWCYRR